MSSPLLLPDGYRPLGWFRTSSIANSLLAAKEGSSALCEVQLRPGWTDPQWFADGLELQGRTVEGWLLPAEVHAFTERGAAQVRPFVPCVDVRALCEVAPLPPAVVTRLCGEWARAALQPGAPVGPAVRRSFRLGWDARAWIAAADFNDPPRGQERQSPPEQGPESPVEPGLVYELGVFAFWLLAGVDPFALYSSPTERQLLKLRGEHPLLGQLEPSLPDRLLEVVELALDPSPERRPSLRRLVEELSSAVPPIDQAGLAKWLRAHLWEPHHELVVALAGALGGTVAPSGEPFVGQVEREAPVEAVERQVAEHPYQLDGWRVLGDALSQQGALRGELLAIDAELEALDLPALGPGLEGRAARAAVLLERRYRLLGNHPALIPGEAHRSLNARLRWRFGFVWHATIEGEGGRHQLEPLLNHPSMRHLQRLDLHLGGDANAHARTLAAIGHPTVRRLDFLRLPDREGPLRDLTLAFPRLERVGQPDGPAVGRIGLLDLKNPEVGSLSSPRLRLGFLP